MANNTIKYNYSTTDTSGHVTLVDPNNINSNNGSIDGFPFTNGIPQYQDMYIFAELTAKSRGRTIIIGNTVKSDDEKTINLLGMNQDVESPDLHNFTTNYYDGSMGDKDVLESFGITNIKISVNSSYVPQVNIQFVDIKGLSFFNQDKSPYRILFDFPPPIFKLIVKGYYGKSLTYHLHMVNYTTEFQANSGNFVIDANFVAMTFAPLSDILFRYIVNVPLINGVTSSPKQSNEPKNTNDLILKLKSLYSIVKDKVSAETEVKSYDSLKLSQENITNTFNLINDFNKSDALKTGGDVFLIQKNIGTLNTPSVDKSESAKNEDSGFVSILNTSTYNKMINTSIVDGTDVSTINRLMLGYIVGTNISESELNGVSDVNNNKQRIDELSGYLNKFSDLLLTSAGLSSSSKIPSATIDYNNHCLNPDKQSLSKYVVIDITNFYIDLYKKSLDIESKKNTLTKIITDKVNSIVIDELGMLPTIYNIFKIILDDVDTFFLQLRKCAETAETLHSADFDIISSFDKSINPADKHIYAFPLVTKQSIVSGGNREERIAPIELSKKTKFPELEFVSDFINSFQLQRELTAENDFKNQVSSNGTTTYIPISPIDTTLSGGSPKSPYIGVGTAEAIANTLPIKTQIYQILLKRYYMLSQGILPNDFFSNGTVDGRYKLDNASQVYRDLFAKAEAVNLITSLQLKSSNGVNSLYDTIKQDVDVYLSNNGVAEFRNTLKTIVDFDESGNQFNLYDFPVNSVKLFLIDSNDTDYGVVALARNHENFVGINLYDGVIEQRTQSENTIIDEFNKNAETSWYKKDPAEVLFKFSSQNLIQFKDSVDDDGIYVTNDGTSLVTRYLTSIFIEGMSYDEVLNNGNIKIASPYINYNNTLNHKTSISNTWSNDLALFGDNFEDDILNNHSKLSAMYILSSFGHAAGVYNTTLGLNDVIFTTPSVIEIPRFLQLYIGALVDAIDGGIITGDVEDTPYPAWENSIHDFLKKDGVSYNDGLLIAADIHDIKKYMSINDKLLFKKTFNEYYYDISEIGYASTLSKLNGLWIDSKSELPVDGTKQQLIKIIEKNLNPKSANGNGNAKYYQLIQPLMQKSNIINYSQITFRMDTLYNPVGVEVGYKSLADINNVTDTKKVSSNSDVYFKTFFTELKRLFGDADKEQKIKKDNENKLRGDVDILTQTYYSFKNINDRWLAGQQPSLKGYPFNREGKSLIDSFAFVDRAMNPIGDTIINAELLLQIFDDPNISVFTALSQLLSSNGFEFFPLQNFMKFDRGGWEDSFKIDTSGVNEESNAFVCMYIGGSSSQLSISGNGFENDGILDLSNPGITDFSNTAPNTDEMEPQERNLNNFPWREVNAFRVRFGEQNQSMFTDIKIDSKEFPETNESIQILSRLAGDSKNTAPPPIGQNLYNLYENRSYRATITSLGNVMIQPTQYFQLENIPLFNGAYIILGVEHNITGNKMITSFSGTKMIKYPSPRVLSPVSFIGLDSVASSSLNAGQFVVGALLTNYKQTQYNSMYTLKIK